ncbi:unnamed protein product [Sphenostylis stenocarpa]|uniref:J domain-containing protein n=1 Tax=Sphenostylis stenocarpa TaxID=92480 RepID=A0AA86VUG7_9FABA|nr:unnamed protein product [Sphenostylis stenocarpa]
MEKGGEKCSEELYEVLGIEKECTPSELKKAYKKLALKWHPDRCSGSRVEEGKKKFQAIQYAYSESKFGGGFVLRIVLIRDELMVCLFEQGMGDFLNEMATMMSQSKPSVSEFCEISVSYAYNVKYKAALDENREESFEELQQLFEEMFQANIGSVGSSSHTAPASSVEHLQDMKKGRGIEEGIAGGRGSTLQENSMVTCPACKALDVLCQAIAEALSSCAAFKARHSVLEAKPRPFSSLYATERIISYILQHLPLPLFSRSLLLDRYLRHGFLLTLDKYNA